MTTGTAVRLYGCDSSELAVSLRVGRDELTAEVDVADDRSRVGWNNPVAPREAKAYWGLVVVTLDLALVADRFCVEERKCIEVDELLIEANQCARGALFVHDEGLAVVFQCGEASTTKEFGFHSASFFGDSLLRAK